LNFITTVFRVYLKDQSMDHLSGALRRGGIKDVMAFFPINKRTPIAVEGYFKAAGLPQVADWYAKRQTAVVKENTTKGLKDMMEAEESQEDVVAFLKKCQ